jgi:hypothetical protein
VEISEHPTLIRRMRDSRLRKLAEAGPEGEERDAFYYLLDDDTREREAPFWEGHAGGTA